VLRRQLLKHAAAAPLFGLASLADSRADAAPALGRIRPPDAAWPSAAQWEGLNAEVGGKLVKPQTVWEACAAAPGSGECLATLKQVRNPFYLGDNPGGTQVSGWLDAWVPKASAYAVEAA